MSTQPIELNAELDMDIADRMRKCLRAADMNVGDIANYFGVTRGTVGNWINGRVVPPMAMQILWSHTFADYGVTLQWLQTGDAGPHTSGPAFRFVAGTGFEPVTSGFQAHHLQMVA
jgi:transcriptional regulator with XRE-family HTH domain